MMRTRVFSFWPVLLLAPFVLTLLLPQTGHSFWYGDETNVLTEYLDSAAASSYTNALNYYTDILIDEVLPSLSDNLTFNDNRYADTGVSIPDTGEAYSGYTLLSVIKGKQCFDSEGNPRNAPGAIPLGPPGSPLPNSCGAMLIDMEGNLVNEWPMMAVPAEMLPGGDVLGFVISGPPVGGIPSVSQMDWCGNEVWRWDGPSPARPGGARVHHDMQVHTNPVYHSPTCDTNVNHAREGRVLILSNHDEFIPSLGFFGIEVDWSNFPLQDDAIYEIDRAGNVLWSWFPADHKDDMGFSDEALEAIRTIRSQGIGGPPLGTFGPTDWAHLNTAGYVGKNKWYQHGDERFHPDNILIDSRTANYIAIIARYDNPGSWYSGDIIWRVGPHYHEGYPEHGIGQIIGPHMAHMIPKGLPGEGNILLFDNGGMAGYDILGNTTTGYYPATVRHYSRIVEFNPVTLEKVWEYLNPVERLTDVLERKFYSRLISGAQRLPNGNTMITEGQPGRIFEVNRSGKIVWEFIVPASLSNGNFGLGPGAFLPNYATYRANRVPYDWIPKNMTCE
jgi:hypothetical protein